MRIFLFTVFILSTNSVWGQELSTKYADLITTEGLYDKLSILASDALEGRETGERGQKMAAAFIQNHFDKLGLIPPVQNHSDKIYQQQLPLYASVPGDVFVTINGERRKNFEDVIYMSSEFSNTEMSLELVFAGLGSETVLNKLDMKGKAVVFLPQKKTAWRPIVDKLKSAGAKLALVVTMENQDEFAALAKKEEIKSQKGELKLEKQNPKEQGDETGVFFMSLTTAGELFNRSFTKLMAEAIRMETGRRISGKIKPAEFSYQAQSKIKTVLTENVLGYLEGTDKKDELLVITAHYDHIGINGELINNGADDDASGTSSVMQLAEAFVQAKKDGNGPRRSILFMTVTGEEKGLLGSAYYANNPVFPLENTVANLNIDMIGRVDPKHASSQDYVYLVGSDKLSSELHKISEQANAKYTKMELDYTYNDESHPSRIYYRSDHWNFAKNNVPIIFYFNGIHEDYHKPTDTVEKINFDLLAKRAKLVFYTAWELANREDRIVLDTPK
jgi:hypothetical protein